VGENVTKDQIKLHKGSLAIYIVTCISDYSRGSGW
jgi:hypothetical protein